MNDEDKTLDDALEENRQPDTGAGSNPLPEDNDTPAAPASDTPDDSSGSNDLPEDHPSTDSNVDSSEEYDEGTKGAAGV